jgi:hypothetical protein
MEKILKRKRFKLKDEDGNYIGSIGAISLVKTPAIDKSFGLFEGVEPKQIKFEVTNKEKRIVTGVAMTSNKDILRYDEELDEYFMCYFTQQDVVDYAEYFMRYADTRSANLHHNRNFFDDFFVFESWIVENPEMDKSKELGLKDVDKGDWIISYKVTSDEMWNKIQEEGLTGFSIEIALQEFEDAKIRVQLEGIIDDASLTKEQKKEKIRQVIFK